MNYHLDIEFGGKTKKIALKLGENHLGSAPEANIQLKAEGISEAHALIVVEEQGVWIQDLESANGTYVNGVPITESRWLESGDELYFGAQSKAIFNVVEEKKAKPGKKAKATKVSAANTKTVAKGKENSKVAQQPSAASTGSNREKSSPSFFKRRWKLLSLLTILALLVYFVGSFLGLFRPNVSEIFGGAPDLVASQTINAQLNNLGITGADAIVLPIKGEAGQVAVITLGTEASFGDLGDRGMETLIGSVMQSNREGGFNITQVAFGYADENGDNLFTMATDIETLELYSTGIITREEMLERTEADFSNIFSAYRELSNAGEGQ